MHNNGNIEMNPFYRPATDTQDGECLNFIPTKDGTLVPIEPTKNAVIVQLVESFTDEGERLVGRVVCIECVDEKMYPDLKAEAQRILCA